MVEAPLARGVVVIANAASLGWAYGPETEVSERRTVLDRREAVERRRTPAKRVPDPKRIRDFERGHTKTDYDAFRTTSSTWRCEGAANGPPRVNAQGTDRGSAPP
jgi:hypothetical protein